MERDQAEGLHELHFDFMFMGQEDQPKQTLRILVAKERRTKMVMATVVPSKSTGRFVAERINAFIKEIGVERVDIVAKSDQEPSIKRVVEDVGRHMRRRSWTVDYGIVACGQFRVERSGRARYSVGTRPSESAEGRVGSQVEEGDSDRRMCGPVDRRAGGPYPQ